MFLLNQTYNLPKFQFGQSYLIDEQNRHDVLSQFDHLEEIHCDSIVITRNNLCEKHGLFQSSKICNFTKNGERNNIDHSFSCLHDLDCLVKSFCSERKNAVVILYRTDVLITNFSFASFLKTIYALNDIVRDTHSLLLVYIDKQLLDFKEIILLKKELDELYTEEPVLSKDLLDILSFAYTKYTQYKDTHFKNILESLDLTYPTVRKRVRKLEKLGYIKIWKNGRNKTIQLTEKGIMKIYNKFR